MSSMLKSYQYCELTSGEITPKNVVVVANGRNVSLCTIAVIISSPCFPPIDEYVYETDGFSWLGTKAKGFAGTKAGNPHQ